MIFQFTMHNAQCFRSGGFAIHPQRADGFAIHPLLFFPHPTLPWEGFQPIPKSLPNPWEGT